MLGEKLERATELLQCLVDNGLNNILKLEELIKKANRCDELEEENQTIDDMFKILSDNMISLPLDCYHEETGQYTHTEYKEIDCIDDMVDWIDYAVNHDFENDFNENDKYIELGKAIEMAFKETHGLMNLEYNKNGSIQGVNCTIALNKDQLLGWYRNEVK